MTTVARTLFDLAEVTGEQQLERAFEEADRLRLLEVSRLEEVCARGHGRRALRPIQRMVGALREPATTRSALEERFAGFCREQGLPAPATNVSVEGREVDALWPRERLVVELDGFAFHHHRAAFERDRARDAAMQAAGYSVVRLTHRRLDEDAGAVADELRRLLRATPAPAPAAPGVTPPTPARKGSPSAAPSRAGDGDGSSARHEKADERGQGTVEWVALLLVVALVFTGLLAAGVRVPGAALARAIASRVLCAASMADSCGDEPRLIAAYGSEVGRMVHEHIASLAYERGSRAVPIDFRRCRERACADAAARGLTLRSDAGLPVTAFVHVVDCRNPGQPGSVDAAGPENPAAGPGRPTAGPASPAAVDALGNPASASGVSAGAADCSGARAGNLYLQYWFYYPESATLRGVPVAGARGYHRDDWESLQVRIAADGSVAQRASSHHGYNHVRGVANAGSDAGIEPLKDAAEALGARPRGGWGRESPLLFVSGGSHAGNVGGYQRIDRLTPGRRVHLVPLEPIAAAGAGHRFAVTPPWLKRVWRDPEAEGTD